jgi:hypothetical protein
MRYIKEKIKGHSQILSRIVAFYRSENKKGNFIYLNEILCFMRTTTITFIVLSLLILFGCVKSDEGFQAKIDDQILFNADGIDSVCTTADCSGLDPAKGCIESEIGYTCFYRFQVTLTQESADKLATATNNLQLAEDGTYLSSPIEFYKDGEKIESLKISADVKGKSITMIPISGEAEGVDRQSAAKNALDKMKEFMSVVKS